MSWTLIDAETSGDAYISSSEAGVWLSEHVTFITAWTAATSAQKTAALFEASDAIDSLPLKGCKYADDQTQDRAFPRIPDRAAQTIGTDETNFQSDQDYSQIPQEVLDATCLEALEILKQGSSGRKELREQGVKSYSLGGKLSESFVDEYVPKLLSRKAREKLRFWIAGIVEAT